MIYDLYITYKCNWFCEYCIIDTHNKKKEIEEVYREIINIPDGSRVCIMGGEPGTVEKLHIDNIIYKLKEKNCSLELMTNGLFLERYPEHIDSFDYILYHCSENLDSDFKRYKDKNIEYQITVSDNNFKNLSSFFKKNSDIIFRVFSASKGPISKRGNYLSMKNKIELATKYKKHISKDSIAKILERCST